MNFLTTLGEIDPELENRVCTYLEMQKPCHLAYLQAIKMRQAVIWPGIPEHQFLESILETYKQYNKEIEQIILRPETVSLKNKVLQALTNTHGEKIWTIADVLYFSKTEDKSFLAHLQSLGVEQKDLELFWS